MNKSGKNNVRFNVGGRIFEVARSTIEKHPDCMLARMIDTMWEREDRQPGDALFIDRNGDRFQYVLDYARDGRIFLPITECRQQIAYELIYFGFNNIDEDVAISQMTLDGGRVMGAIASNVSDELDSMEKEINGMTKKLECLQKKQFAVRAAQNLLMRANSAPPEQNSFQITMYDGKDLDSFGEATRDAKEFLDERLQQYGLKLVQYPREYISRLMGELTVTLERLPMA